MGRAGGTDALCMESLTWDSDLQGSWGIQGGSVNQDVKKAASYFYHFSLKLAFFPGWCGSVDKSIGLWMGGS